MISAQKFETERAELRSRLEHAQPIGNGAAAAASGTLNLTSQGLTALYNSLAAQDKNRRPKPRVSLDTLQSPAGAIPPGLTTPASAGGHRDSLSSASYKKGSFSAGGAVPPPTPLRQLNARDEERFGVSTPIERITSGVSFRTDKLLKLRQAKSQIQTQKISQALVQLEIPDLLSLPTTRVVAAFEQLIGKINILLDAKKLLTKEETELATAKSIKEELDRAKAIENGEEVDVEKDADGEEDEEDAEGEEDDAEGEDDDGDTPMTDAPKAEDKVTRPSSSRSNAAAGFMRSGSVLSTASSRGSRRKK
jgi:DNA methyltransferase 1-associated protein 1